MQYLSFQNIAPYIAASCSINHNCIYQTQTRGSEKLRSILSEKATERTSGDVDVVSILACKLKAGHSFGNCQRTDPYLVCPRHNMHES